MSKPVHKDLTKLGAGTTEYKYDGADKKQLERFPNPLTTGPGRGEIHIEVPEFTSLCPMTGQPDFATIIIDYWPKDWCVESKALKLYLGTFRNFGEFHESCVRRIANDLIELLDPWSLTVKGEFTPRGGIPFWPEVDYVRPLTVFKFYSEDVPNLDDRNAFFLGDKVFEVVNADDDYDTCSLWKDDVFLGTARVAECEVGSWSDMARKYVSNHHLFKDRNRLKAYLEENNGDIVLHDDVTVTVVWFSDIHLFGADQDLGDSSGIVPLKGN